MPMQLTVSRNRKTSENYNSQGYGVSLTKDKDRTANGTSASVFRSVNGR